MKRLLEGIRVLVVEDDPDNLELLEVFLMGEGAAVTTARSGSEARDRVAVSAPAVVISDLGLPDEDGCALLAAIRQSPSHAPIGAIALTGRTDRAAVLRATAAGFDRHLAKPVDLTALVEAIAELGAHRGQPRAGA